MGINDDRGGEQTAAAIGRQLKSTYGKLLAEPVPQKFLDLLSELEAKTKLDASGDEDGESQSLKGADK